MEEHVLPVYGLLLAVTVPVGTLDHTASTKVCTYVHAYMQPQKHVSAVDPRTIHCTYLCS